MMRDSILALVVTFDRSVDMMKIAPAAFIGALELEHGGRLPRDGRDFDFMAGEFLLRAVSPSRTD